MTLDSGAQSREVLIIGAEGDVEKAHVRDHGGAPGLPLRTVRAQLWMSGRLVQKSGAVRMTYTSGGYLDHGTYYAANSFTDPKTGRRIVYGWIPEEDVSAEFAHRKRWNGFLAIPRELVLLRIPNVVKALRSELSELSMFEQQVETNGSLTLTTLGIRPIRELESARGQCRLDSGLNIVLRDLNVRQQMSVFEAAALAWELEVTMSVDLGCNDLGFCLYHDKKHGARTSIIFSLLDESITVDRSSTTAVEFCNKCPDKGPFTLFSTRNAIGEQPEEHFLETLRLRIISDGNVLEVFANDRFALATTIYPEGLTPQCEITAFASGKPGSTVSGKASLWDGLGLT